MEPIGLYMYKGRTVQKRDFTEFLENENFIRWVVSPNAESDHFWKSWIDSNPERKEDVQAARNFLNSIEYKRQFRLDDEKYTSGLYRLIDLHGSEGQRSPLNYSMVWKTVAVAAIVIIALFIGLQLDHWQTATENEVLTQNITKQTEFGQKLIIRLPDGSVVHLNAGSKISYPKPFDKDMRELTLTGEAFFEIARDERRPFVIRSGGVSLQVLGTSFNVRAYADESYISVAVESGKVGVSRSDRDENVVVNPNQQATYSNDTGSLSLSDFDRLEVMGWREGIVQFKDMPLNRVMAKLQRVYGVEFLINAPEFQLKERYSGVYKDAPLERILQGISFAVGFDFELDGKIVTIKPKELMNED